MNEYDVHLLFSDRRTEDEYIVSMAADSISSNMAGVLFFHRKTGTVTKNTLPKEIDARDVIEETEVTDIYAPGQWVAVHKQG